jgi:hypothetical protein
LDDLIVGAFLVDLGVGKSYIVFGKIDNTAINLSTIANNSRLIDCCSVNFTKDDIGFTYALFTVYIGLINTNNQIIQAIAVDIACAGDCLVKLSAQQSINLLLSMAQGVLSLTAKVRSIKVGTQSPPQVMSTVMAWMI